MRSHDSRAPAVLHVPVGGVGVIRARAVGSVIVFRVYVCCPSLGER